MKSKSTIKNITTWLPEGWCAERLGGTEDAVLLTSPSRGMVTVDLDARGYRLGCVVTGRLATRKNYAGRDWRRRLVEDAVAALLEAAR